MTTYHAVRRITSPYCNCVEGATLPSDVPKRFLTRWLKDKVIAVGRGDKVVDFVENTGRVSDEDDEDDEDVDIDINNPEEFGADDDGLDDDDEPDEAPAPAPAAKAPKPPKATKGKAPKPPKPPAR